MQAYNIYLKSTQLECVFDKRALKQISGLKQPLLKIRTIWVLK